MSCTLQMSCKMVNLHKCHVIYIVNIIVNHEFGVLKILIIKYKLDIYIYIYIYILKKKTLIYHVMVL